MDKIQEAKAILREAGYFVNNLWHVNDIKDRYECDNATAFEILDNAPTKALWSRYGSPSTSPLMRLKKRRARYEPTNLQPASAHPCG